MRQFGHDVNKEYLGKIDGPAFDNNIIQSGKFIQSISQPQPVRRQQHTIIITLRFNAMNVYWTIKLIITNGFR